MVKNVIIFESHPDDSAVGLGGTIIKLAKEGYYIISVIFTAGQKSHPHLKEEIIIKKRIEEAEHIGKQFGVKQVIFFGLEDNKLKEEIQTKDIYSRIKRLIKKYKPVKIFTTSSSDPHPDHRAVNELILQVINDLNYKSDLYSYEVWNLINENKPVIYNDISKYFKAKIVMMKSFKSQFIFIYLLLIPVYLRALYYGFKNNCKYAEKFYKLR
mgnify:CR=1 FL=1